MSEIISRTLTEDVSIVICGEAGQGIQTVERLLTRVLKFAGFNVFATKEYMSRVRGGSNSTQIRVSSKMRSAFVNGIDILIPLDKDAIPHLESQGRLSDDTIIIGDPERVKTDRRMIEVPFTQLAAGIGGSIYANTIAIGLIMGLFGIEFDLLADYLRRFFAKKSDDIIQKNIEAGRKGYELGLGYAGPGKVEIIVRRDAAVRKHILLDGAETLALGAVAGGCNFVAAYPMTPSTGILTYLSTFSEKLGVLAEQAEDEISAINMAVGAWYAGARAMVCTAGGGYALMVEGVSLSAMLETPVVVSVGQRPAPATGLPTRTEQGDLEHVLYSGHGEFPRIVFAPGTIEQGFFLMQRAFNLADKYQVPVFVMSDQFFADSYYNVPPFDLSRIENRSYVVKTDRDYRRYALTENGVSPRGIPGCGEGLVCVDSDEHDESGHITEQMSVRKAMVDKRLRKLDALSREIMPPELIGAGNYRTLIVAWGSNHGVIREAMERLGRDDIALLHFSQVYPLHPDTPGYLNKAEQVIMIENNATSQFGRLIRMHTGFDIREKLLKYDGLPFTVEEITEGLRARSGAAAVRR